VAFFLNDRTGMLHDLADAVETSVSCLAPRALDASMPVVQRASRSVAVAGVARRLGWRIGRAIVPLS
jgi:hypothetical protein